MRDVLPRIDQWRAAGDDVAVATVVAVRRSAPRPPGAKMAISASGDVQGMVSGGCVEGAVVSAAQEALEGAPGRLLHFGIADDEAWEVGLPCGGEIDVWVERWGHDALAALARAGGRGARVTRLDDGRSMVVDADGATDGTLGDDGLDAAAAQLADELMWLERSELRERDGVELFVDAVYPPPRLIIFGAVDIAASLCTLARSAGWRSFVTDPRGFFARPDRFPDAEDVVAAWPAEALEKLGGIDRATCIAVLTHDPKLDDAALEIALRSDAAYVGAMGSRRMQEDRRERLLAKGLTDDELARMSAPIGLDLGAITPQETALSIMAEMVALRRGREGGRLRDATGRIHEVGT
jgi:xanthine dehydrogenase accessory factor